MYGVRIYRAFKHLNITFIIKHLTEHKYDRQIFKLLIRYTKWNNVTLIH